MNYSALAATAKTLIKAFGKPVTLVHPSGGTFDPVTGGATGESSTSTVGVGVEVEFEESSMPESLALNASKRLLCAGFAQPVPATDTLVISGASLRVVKVAPLSPGATVLLYDVWVS